MSLPTQTDLAALDYARLGEPFAHGTAGSASASGTLDFARLAEPFSAPSSATTLGGGFVSGSPTLAIGGTVTNPQTAITLRSAAPMLAIGAQAFAVRLGLVSGAPTLSIGAREVFSAAIALVSGAPTFTFTSRSFIAALAFVSGAPTLSLGAALRLAEAITLRSGAPTLALGVNIVTPTTVQVLLLSGPPTLTIGGTVEPTAAITLRAGASTLSLGLTEAPTAAVAFVSGAPRLTLLVSAGFPHVGALQVTGVSPNVVGDPTIVTITGSGFLGATRVMAGPYGTFEAGIVPITVVSDTEIQAEFESPYYLSTGSHDPITVDVQVFTLDQPAGSPLNSPADQITFLAPPTLYSIAPTSGNDSVDTPYTIYGRNLEHAFLVVFGGVGADPTPTPAADGLSLSGTAITAGFQGGLNTALPVQVWNRAGPSQPPSPTFTVYPGPQLPTPPVTPIDDALAGRVGPVRISYRFEQRTRAFVFVRDITKAVKQSGGCVIHLDNEQPVARTADFAIDATALPEGFDASDASGYGVAVWADVITQAETFSIPLGLFHLDLPVQVQRPGAYEEWQAAGSDMTIVLANRTTPIPYVVKAGTVYLNAVGGICAQFGLSQAISVLGGLQYTTPVDLVWPAGTTYLQICNDLLWGINYYPVYADAEGVCRTRFKNDPAAEPPAVFYRTDAEPRMLVGPSQRTQAVATFNNQISVAIDDPLRTPQAAIATNADPASPLSTATSGKVNFVAYGGTSTPSTKGVFNITVATTIADFLCRDQATRAVSRTIQTQPDPRRTGGWESYELTIDGYEAQTLWRCAKWDYTCAPGGPHTHEVWFSQAVTITTVANTLAGLVTTTQGQAEL